MPGRLSRAVIGALVVAAASGCSAGGLSPDDEVKRDLGEIARAYDVVIAASQRPPRALDQIEKVLADLHTDGLVAAQPADVLTSPRDGQPYVIILGADLGASLASEILIYEKRGAEGRRYVLQMNYEVHQLTDEQFGQATFAMGHKPAEVLPAAASP